MPTPFQVPSFTLQDIKKNSLAVITLCLILSNVYFINLNATDRKEYNHRMDSMNNKYFNVMIAMKGYKELSEDKDRIILGRDSMLREKTEAPAKQIINNKK